MANEMLGKKEDLHEVDWVKEQTKSALSGLQKEVLYTKNGNEVKFDVDTSLNYLKTLKDKKTYREVMSQNAGATVMAVQILLKNKGYDIGKIDGILKTQGKSTSKTTEAIAKFQSDNGLTPDGAPGPDTIKKILAIYENGGGNGGGTEVVEDEEKVKDLTEEEYENLLKREELTEEEIRQIVKYVNEGYFSGTKALVHFPNLKKITDNQAEELGKIKDESVFLYGLETLTDKQAELLSGVKGLFFLHLRNITDNQAESLSKVEQLGILGLTNITDNQAEILSKVKDLDLSGLTSITDKQATELAKVEELYIDKDILTPSQKEILKKHIS